MMTIDGVDEVLSQRRALESAWLWRLVPSSLLLTIAVVSLLAWQFHIRTTAGMEQKLVAEHAAEMRSQAVGLAAAVLQIQSQHPPGKARQEALQQAFYNSYGWYSSRSLMLFDDSGLIIGTNYGPWAGLSTSPAVRQALDAGYARVQWNSEDWLLVAHHMPDHQMLIAVWQMEDLLGPVHERTMHEMLGAALTMFLGVIGVILAVPPVARRLSMR